MTASRAKSQARPPRTRAANPYTIAFVSLALGLTASLALVVWARESPERVLVGLSGRHDGLQEDGERRAECLDCHVPFLGTPGTRCLSPGCHGELATGSPPKTGPSMPIRFHVALRGRPCGPCHIEHDRNTGEAKSARIFTHRLIPADAREVCRSCHSGAGLPNHAPTDAIVCSRCHETESWKGIEMNHSEFQRHYCDDCHVAPEDSTHASVAGTCTRCHKVEAWK